jgi:hypothetical protein
MKQLELTYYVTFKDGNDVVHGGIDVLMTYKFVKELT